ncbi:YdcF family protein [Mucilaginibacter sp. cycad4]|uniref:YdcF family protein n=1 Tax=Mucilaginibacter sp. cycad4 TaxID=3342096 RepID=UPI002AAACE53|nr:YdcF family protein [Mucilaginibacter gossypii]WPV00445.1 YdcF family protein [Mucilaginibacter gossypii]
MFFIFSKVLSFLMNLLLWVFVFLLVALFSKNVKRKRKFLITGIIVFYIFSNSVLINVISWCWDVRETNVPAGKKYTCAIVLGGFSSDDGNGGGFFNSSADRFIQGVRLQKTGQVSHLLISGGNGLLMPSGFREADWVRGQLREMQVPDSCILTEPKSRNTIENAAFSKALLQQHKLKGPYLLVTSAFHMRRSMMIFKKQGVDVVAYPCCFSSRRLSVSADDFLPNAGALAGWVTYIKEAIGYVVTRYFK